MNIEPRPEDVSSPNAIINAMYKAISGPRGGRDWNRIRSLYLDGARLIPTGIRANGDDGFRIMDIEAWIDSAGPFFEEADFYEVEIARRTDCFGHIAHAFSTYQCRRSPHGEDAYMTGINSIQMLYRDERWWIVTVFWDNEGDDNRIPEVYLP